MKSCKTNSERQSEWEKGGREREGEGGRGRERERERERKRGSRIERVAM